MPRFHWLPQDFQDSAFKLGKLVKKQDAVVG
jgi:hypothetical protein